MVAVYGYTFHQELYVLFTGDAYKRLISKFFMSLPHHLAPNMVKSILTQK